MNKFKFKQSELASIKLLKKDPNFTAFMDSLSRHLVDLDSSIRATYDPNVLLKVSGMAKQIEDVLDSITTV